MGRRRQKMGDRKVETQGLQKGMDSRKIPVRQEKAGCVYVHSVFLSAPGFFSYGF